MPTFTELSLILVIVMVMALVMHVLRLPLILGYVLTGVLVGPQAFHLLRAEETIALFSQFGITALLFIVGLQLSPRVMREMGKAVALTGVLQMGAAFVFGSGLTWLFTGEIRQALLVGAALMFSSTIIALKVLSDKKDLGKLHGKLTTGLLLVQDLGATTLLLFFSSWQRAGGWQESVVSFLLKWLILALGLWIFARYILARLTDVFARSQEFLFLFSIGWGVGLATLFHVLGLSYELGALVAGVTLASSPYHYEISAKMKLLRDFFIVLFFVLIGSRLSWQDPVQNSVLIVALTVYMLVGTPFLVTTALRRLGYHYKTALTTGIALIPMSEFSLLFILTAYELGWATNATLSIVVAVAGVSMTIGSLANWRNETILARIGHWFIRSDNRQRSLAKSERRKQYEVLLFGCHRVGGDFLPSLKKWRRSFLVVDFDPAAIHDLEEHHIPCRYGDMEDNELLDELGLERVKMVISTIPDYQANLFLLTKLRKVNDRALAILVSQNVEEAMLMYEHGASYVIMPHFLGGNYASLLVDRFGYDADKFFEERKKHLEHLKGRGTYAVNKHMLEARGWSKAG